MAKTTIVFNTLCVVVLSLALFGEEIGLTSTVTTMAAADTAAADAKGPAVSFGADVSKMLGILINSLYTNRNIFLREIISNASDALDKVRFLYLTNPPAAPPMRLKDSRHIKEGDTESHEAPTMDIRIRVDEDKRTFTMVDGGVGMTADELRNNLGSLGTSGTKAFLEKMKESEENSEDGISPIGQFGVGFYSIFLVADRVTVATKNDNSEKQWVWESTGDGTYFVYEDERGNTLGRGTEITLFLKSDAREYLDVAKIKETIHKYSEFIHFPIYIEASKTEKVKVDREVDETKEDDSEAPAAEEEEKEVTTYSWELVNENKPIWIRNHNEITEDDYNQFYKSLSKDYANPMFYHHFSVEGGLAFKAILFVPGKAPSNPFGTDGSATTSNNIRLYVRRVFITDEFKDLLPRYLNFIQGVVDSDDLPLNVSREVLQESRILKVVKKKLVRSALRLISSIAESDAKLKKGGDDKEDDSEDDSGSSHSKKLTAETYPKFWEEYGKNIRLGIIEDGNNRARLTKLLRYKSTHSEDEYISLQDYIDNIAENNKKQKNIYYLSGDTIEKIKQSPVLEDATRRNIEVIYMTDAIDEYVVGHITDFSGKKLVNLAKEGAASSFEEDDDEADDSDDKKANKRQRKAIANKRKEKYEPLFKFFRTLLGEKVTKVVITKRKTSEPMILSSRQHDMTARMASIMKGQALGAGGGQASHERTDSNIPTTKRVMELNHLHPLIDEIFRRVQVDENDSVAEDLGLALFDTANIQNGFEIEDSLAFSRRVNRLLRSSVDIAPDAPLIEEDLSQYEVEDDAEAEADVDAEAANDEM